MTNDEPPFKPVVWVGSSRKDLRKFPEPVQDHMGYALYVAQQGGKHRDTKTLSGLGGAGARGGADSEGGKGMSKKDYEVGGRNVFEDIGVPNAEEHLVKAQLVYKIDTIMKQRQMKQTEAAALFAVRQPDISKMLRGEFRQFSVERLLRFLVKLDQDVEIVVKPHRDRHNAPALHVS
jgi:predicted XRE-type DNA-binding protein